MSVKIKIKGKSKIQEFARFVAKTYSPMMGWLVYDADSHEAWTTYCAQGQSELQVRGNQYIIAKEGSMDYKAYLEATRGKDCRANWIAWQVEIRGMDTREATRAAYDKDWGYTPLDY